MSLVSSSIPSLANGVSQQPPTARLSSQGEEQLNGMSSVVEGNAKRSPTHHIAKIITGTVGQLTLHMINRDVTERYDVAITNNNIQVFDLAGVAKTVTIEDADGYLVSANASTAFRAVSIADYTIIVNTEKTVRMKPAGGTAQLAIVQPVTGDVYSVFVRPQSFAEGVAGYTASYTVTAGQTAAQVAGGITTALNAVGGLNTNFTVTNTTMVNGTPCVKIAKAFIGESPFDITVELNGEYLVGNFRPIGAADVAAPSDTSLYVYEPDGEVGFFFVKQGNYGTKYKVTVGFPSGTSYNAEITTSNTVVTDIDTKNIASSLYNTLVAVAGFNTDFTATLSGNLIKIVPDAIINPLTGGYYIKAEDGNGNRNLIAVKDSLQKFTDLPATCFPDFRIKIIGDEANDEDDYYVKFVASRGADPDVAIHGVWDEVAQYGSPQELEPKFMPHVLIRQASGDFTFGQQDWDVRPAGDVDSNPSPSFVDKAIKDVVFFRNRLGFLADENIIQSAAGGSGYFRFFRQTVTAVLDGDPIDVAASNVSVSILRNAVPFSGDKMLLFSDQKQFVYSGGDLLTPKTASIKPSTSYEAVPGCKPVLAGKAVYFPTPKGDNSGLREYATDATTAVDDATDVTAHIPAYVPANVFKIAAAPNEDMLVLLTRDDPTNIYVYKYLFVGNDKLQASWSKWPMGGSVLDANFLASSFELAIQREDGVYLERMGIEAFRNDENMEYEVLLDRRFTAGANGDVDPVYNSTTNTSTIALPYATSGTVQAVVRDDGAIPGGYYESQMLAVTKSNTNASITMAGDMTLVPLIIGVRYTYSYTLSEIVLKQPAGQGGERPLTGGRLQLRTLTLVFDRTGYFRVEVTPLYGDTYTYEYSPKTLGSYEAGAFELASDEFKVPVAARSTEVTIRIVNDSPFPSRFLSATWEGEFILKTRRM